MNDKTEDRDIGNSADSNTQREALKKLADLKKANLRAVFGSGIGRLSLVIVGIAFATIFSIGAYKVFGNKKPVAPPPSANKAMIDAPGAQGQGSDYSPANDQEAQMRRQRNQQQADEARSSGAAYIAPPVLKPEQPKEIQPSTANGVPGATIYIPTAPKGTPEEQRVKLQEQVRQQTLGATGGDLQRRDLQGVEIKQLKDSLRKDEIMPQIMVASGRGWKGEPVNTFTTSSYTLPDRVKTALPDAAVTSGSANAALVPGTTPTILFSAGEACYGFSDFSINSDNPGNDVVASIPVCKKQKNMKVIGKYELKNQAQGVSFVFSKLSIPGKGTFSIQAIAINENTFGTGIVDDVDNHYFRRFGLTALASFVSGMGKAAQVVVGSTTTNTNGLASQTTTVQSPMSTGRQFKIAAGETAQQIGDELKKSNQNIQPTVMVYGPQDQNNKSSGIGIVFLSDVIIDEKK